MTTEPKPTWTYRESGFFYQKSYVILLNGEHAGFAWSEAHAKLFYAAEQAANALLVIRHYDNELACIPNYARDMLDDALLAAGLKDAQPQFPDET